MCYVFHGHDWLLSLIPAYVKEDTTAQRDTVRTLQLGTQAATFSSKHLFYSPPHLPCTGSGLQSAHPLVRVVQASRVGTLGSWTSNVPQLVLDSGQGQT